MATRRIHIDCNGKTGREILQNLAGEIESSKNGRRLVLVVDNIARVNDSLTQLLRRLLAFFNEREIKAAIVDSTGCASTLSAAIGGSVHLQVCRSEEEIVAPMHLLVVEDTQDSLDFLRTLLEAAGHRVTTAKTGAEALALCGKNAFDLVLLDLVLPDLDGLAVARRMGGARPPIIAMSAHLDRWSERDFRGAGFVREIRKPFRTADLLAALRR